MASPGETLIQAATQARALTLRLETTPGSHKVGSPTKGATTLSNQAEQGTPIRVVILIKGATLNNQEEATQTNTQQGAPHTGAVEQHTLEAMVMVVMEVEVMQVDT